MSYQVLARKWRPRSFKDMVGQEHILRMLTNALEQKRLHHAYLFTGTRGVGKTTIARILAKCLNCEVGITATPCGTCHTCMAIDNGQFLDLFEVDAASRTKVEDTRDLLENVLYPPTQGRYKVYLIDEVHMLSNHSFNALLKTLEEPPEHVKFLLATTDPKKLPITILSRCLQFHLKRIVPEQISQHLEHICKAENIAYEVPALERLAIAADGSMRDALSLLDQAIAYGHSKVTNTEVHSMLGSMAQDDLLPLLEALAEKDGQKVFQLMSHLAERAPDFQQVLEEFINILHQVAIEQVVPAARENTQADHGNAAIKTLAKKLSAEDVQLYYQIALLGRRDIQLTPNPKQGFEMTLLRMLAFKPGLVVAQTASNTISHVQPAAAQRPVSKQAAAPASTPVAATKNEQPVTPSSTEWRDILPKLELTGMAYALASNCMLESIKGNKVVLALAASHQPMLNQKLKERLEEALGRHLKQTVDLEVKISATVLVTPHKQHIEEKSQQLSSAKETMLQDPKVKQLLEMYDATVEVSLL